MRRRFLVQPTLLGHWANMAFLEVVRMLDVNHDGRVTVDELMALDLDNDGRCVCMRAWRACGGGAARAGVRAYLRAVRAARGRACR